MAQRLANAAPQCERGRSTVELALGCHEGHAVNGKIAVVGLEHHRALVPAGQQDEVRAR